MTTIREQYFKETQKRWSLILGWWQVFSALVTGEIFNWDKLKALAQCKPFRVGNFEAVTREEWDEACKGTLLDPAQSSIDAPNLAGAVDQSYFQHYAWANGLAIYYASLYRSAFVTGYLLAAAAVFLALISMASGLSESQGVYFIGLELGAILTILGVTWWGRRQHWHERSVDYRMLAERLRLARFLAVFGGGGQQVSLAAHLAMYGNPAATWMHWHYHAIERAAGLASIRFTSDYLEASQKVWLKYLVEGQISYHHSAATRYKKLDRRVHFAGVALFFLTLIACALHVTGRMCPGPARWLTIVAAFFPALGAALAAIRSQAEAHRLSRRSYAMKKNLEQLRLELASTRTRGGEGNSQRLRARADRITDLMVREMLDWRVVLLDQPLETHV